MLFLAFLDSCGLLLSRAISVRAAAFALWSFLSFLWHLGFADECSKFLNVFDHVPKLQLFHEEMLVFLAVKSGETAPLVPQVIYQAQKGRSVTIEENVAILINRNVVSSGKHFLQERALHATEQVLICLNLMRSTNIKAQR